MVRLGALLRRSRNKDAEPEAQAPVGPTIDTPPLVVMIPDVAGVSSFRLYTFTDAQAASRFILSLSRPQRERAHAFWALQAEPADPLETEDNAGEAMVLIRSEEGSDLVYVVSFVDIESAQSFARFEVKRGMHLGLILIYWASMVNVVLTDDKVQLIPERPPRVAARLPVSPASPGTSYRVADAETEFDDRLAMEEVQAEEHRLAVETAERARLDAEAVRLEEEEQRGLAAEAEERARLEAEAEERRLAAEAEEQTRLEGEAEEQRRLAAEAEARARLEAEAEERRRLEEEAERWRLEAEAEDRARLEAAAEERRRLEAEAEERALAEAIALEKRRLQEEEEERFQAAKRSILAQEEEDFGAGGDDDEHEEAVAGSTSEASFERNPIEELLRGEAESRVQVPQAFAKESQDGADEDSPNGLEHEI